MSSNCPFNYLIVQVLTSANKQSCIPKRTQKLLQSTLYKKSGIQ